MKKILLTLGMALTLIAQDEQPPKKGEEEELTPQKAIQILREVQSLMQKSEDLLENSSRGKDLLTDEQVMKVILKELEEMKDPNPAEIQKKVVEKLKNLMEKSASKQKEAADKMTELVKKIQSQAGQGSRPGCQKGSCPKPGHQKKQAQKPQKPNNPATKPYQPNRKDPPSVFRSLADKSDIWGNLPMKDREKVITESRLVDKMPPEYRAALEEFLRRLSEEKDGD